MNQVSEYRVKLEEEDRRQLALDLAKLLKRDEEPDERWSFGELAVDWLKRVTRVKPENEQRHVRHMASLMELREPGRHAKDDDLTKAAVEHCFGLLDKATGGTLGPAMLNKLRSTGRLIIDDARANRRWFAPNPFDAVRLRRVPRKPWPRVTSTEIAAVFRQLRPDRRREAMVMIHMGFRPGELKALRKEDIDFKRGFVTIQRSNGRNETKTGTSREVPIPDAVRSVLEEACRISQFALVFPRADGSMQRADTKLSRTLRAAFKAAGVVSGFKLSCRRRACGFRVEKDTSGALDLLCPKCGFTLWKEGIPKRFTWYGLRHASATLHREFGADALAVKTALGWVQRDVGDDVYTHLSDERYRAEMNRLAVPVTVSVQEPRVNEGLQERRMGFEPTTPSLGSLGHGQAEAFALGSILTYSVNDLAVAFKVSADTIYRMAKLGRLPSIRLGHAIRFPQQTVAAFIRQGRTANDSSRGTGSSSAEAVARRRARKDAARRRSKLH